MMYLRWENNFARITQKEKRIGPTGNRTPTKGFKVLCADRYTIEPWLPVYTF